MEKETLIEFLREADTDQLRQYGLFVTHLLSKRILNALEGKIAKRYVFINDNEDDGLEVPEISDNDNPSTKPIYRNTMPTKDDREILEELDLDEFR